MARRGRQRRRPEGLRRLNIAGLVHVTPDARIVDSDERRGVPVEKNFTPTDITLDSGERIEEPPIEQYGITAHPVVGRRERIADAATIRRPECFDGFRVDKRHIAQGDDRSVDIVVQRADARADGTRLPRLERRVVHGPDRKPRNRLGDAVGLVADDDDDRIEAGIDERPGGEFDDRVSVLAREQFVLVAESGARPSREENPGDVGVALRRVERRFVDRE